MFTFRVERTLRTGPRHLTVSVRLHSPLQMHRMESMLRSGSAYQAGVKDYVALLRGINVGGKIVGMSDLRSSFGAFGAEGVETYLRSGNVIFSHDMANPEMLSAGLGEMLGEKCGFEISVLIRDRDEMRRVVGEMPFENMDRSKIHVTFLSSAPAGMQLHGAEQAASVDEEIRLSGKHVYLYCPEGYGSTRLSNNFLERKLKVSATTRNWRSVNAILTMLEER